MKEIGLGRLCPQIIHLMFTYLLYIRIILIFSLSVTQAPYKRYHFPGPTNLEGKLTFEESQKLRCKYYTVSYQPMVFRKPHELSKDKNSMILISTAPSEKSN